MLCSQLRGFAASGPRWLRPPQEEVAEPRPKPVCRRCLLRGGAYSAQSKRTTGRAGSPAGLWGLRCHLSPVPRHHHPSPTPAGQEAVSTWNLLLSRKEGQGLPSAAESGYQILAKLPITPGAIAAHSCQNIHIPRKRDLGHASRHPSGTPRPLPEGLEAGMAAEPQV